MQPRTLQQTAILNVLKSFDRPVSPRELLEAASVESPGLGLATVYRALKKLLDSGEVRKIEVAGLPPHFERTGLGHHHFFVCEECRKIFDLHGCPGGLQKILPKGFRMKSHEVVIHGSCRECSLQQAAHAS
jgi:Fur family ferric uptake transcriptional regulator